MPLWPYFRKVRLRAEEPGVALDELVLGLAELLGPRLAVELVEQRLGVERLQVARPAGHEQEDDRLRLGREVRRLRGERVGRAGAGLLLLEHRGEREPAEAAEGVADELAAGPGRPGVGQAGVRGHRGTRSG